MSTRYRVVSCVAFYVSVLWCVATVPAAEFHIAPDGKPTGDGSRSAPWDLQTALSHPATVKPGDTLLLRGGTYRGSFFSELNGERGKPIVVRQAPGERVVIDIEPVKRGVGFHAHGSWTRFQDLEFTCSNKKRRTEQKGSWPTDVRRGSIESRGDHLQWINLLVHDLGKGFGFWGNGEGGEIYGCLIFNNGWAAPDRGHGHAIYAQNETGTKRIVDNIIFNQFGNGIDVYGSTKATLKGFHVEGNVAFHNGSLYKPGNLTSNLMTGGECPIEDITIKSNFTYAGGIQVGYPWGKVNHSAKVIDNYAVGGISAYYQDELLVQGNELIGEGPLVRLTIGKGANTDRHAINRNTYHFTSKRFGPFVRNRSVDEPGWRALGFDRDSKIQHEPPRGVRVFVRPNRYEAGRAHVAVYNWDRKDTVLVDLSTCLRAGDRFRILNAQHPQGEAIVKGVYDGKRISLEMKPSPLAHPIGMPDYPLLVTQPLFGVFLVQAE